jgi:hypothetical protein
VRPPVVLPLTALFVAGACWLVGGTALADADDLDFVPATDVSWQEVLDRAVAASDETGFEARMVVVALDDDGPHLTEVAISRGAAGGLQVGRAESWLIGRHGEAAFFHDRAGRLLRLRDIDRVRFDLAAVTRNYDITLDGRTTLDTGPAFAVRFERDGVLCERLYVDDATGLVVRRETFMGGAIRRVVALSDLVTTGENLAMPDGPSDDWHERQLVADADRAALAATGWRIPDTLPGGFQLESSFRLAAADALQLVYSDGLYTLTVFEQEGDVDRSALTGAVGYTVDGIPVYRWPGAEPERVVWSGDGQTFTAVTDAPMDTLMQAIAGLPHDQAPGLLTRIGRGLHRVGMWLWPFD